MNKLVLNNLCRSLMLGCIYLVIMPTVINLVSRAKAGYIPVSVATLFTVLMIAYHFYILSKSLSHELAMKTAFFWGGLSGIVLTVAGRSGLAVAHLIWASDKTIETIINIFISSWWLYFSLALFGSFCMLIAPFFRIVLHKDLFRNSRPSPFLLKYSPSSLFHKYILHKNTSNSKDDGFKA